MPIRYYAECMYKILARFFNYFGNRSGLKLLQNPDSSSDLHKI